MFVFTYLCNDRVQTPCILSGIRSCLTSFLISVYLGSSLKDFVDVDLQPLNLLSGVYSGIFFFPVSSI